MQGFHGRHSFFVFRQLVQVEAEDGGCRTEQKALELRLKKGCPRDSHIRFDKAGHQRAACIHGMAMPLANVVAQGSGKWMAGGWYLAGTFSLRTA